MSSPDWRPSCTQALLHARAQLLRDIRQFFYEQGVLEVETPLLCAHTVTDCYIESFSTAGKYLQTSPEYAMKRLLASGSGPIFQITKAFRATEYGKLHNPEFSLVEWYEPHRSYHELMALLTKLLLSILPSKTVEKATFKDVFLAYCHLDPFYCEESTLQDLLTRYNYSAEALENTPKKTLLQWLFSEAVEPHLGHVAPLYVYDFPADQAALAVIREDTPPVAERFELFIAGKEIANGFQELTDSATQKKRFQQDLLQRQQEGNPLPEIDAHLLAALQKGLPFCAGVAVGFDRLLMIQQQQHTLSEVLSFDWHRA